MASVEEADGKQGRLLNGSGRIWCAALLSRSPGGSVAGSAKRVLDLGFFLRQHCRPRRLIAALAVLFASSWKLIRLELVKRASRARLFGLCALAAVVELRRQRHARRHAQRAPADTQPPRHIHQRPRLLAALCQKPSQDLWRAAAGLVVLGGVLHIPCVVEGRRADRRRRSRREVAHERSGSGLVVRAGFDEAACAGEEGAEDDITDNCRGGACAPEIPSAQPARLHSR